MEPSPSQQSNSQHPQPPQHQISTNWMPFPPHVFFPSPPIQLGPFARPPPFNFPPPNPNFYPQDCPAPSMANFYIPPPYCLNNSNHPSVDSRKLDVQQDDKQFIEILPTEINSLKSWLDAQKEKLIPESVRKKPKWSITIPEFKECLRKVKQLSDNVRAFAGCMSEECKNCRCSELERLEEIQAEDAIQVHKESMEAAQNEMKLIQSRLDGRTVEEVKEKLTRIKKKRDRLRRKKERERELERLEEERREKLEEVIDRKMAQVAEAEAAVKKEKEISREADEILFEVKRKIADVKKSLKTLQVLQKLREVRFNRKPVLISTEVTEVFNERVESLASFLRSQLSVYESEQKALQVMLNTEQEADREREMMRKRNKMEREMNEEMDGIKKLLFGAEGHMNPLDPCFPFFQLYDYPSQDPNIFLQVRHQWDRFLVPKTTPGASKVPRMWVSPSEPSSDAWAEWLASNRPSDVGEA